MIPDRLESLSYEKTGAKVCYALDTYREFGGTAITWSPDERMTFGYDSLDRLTSAAKESGAQGYNQTYQYDSIGNLTYYSALGYYYKYSGGKPHAVTHLSTTQGGAGTQKYWYDANGNMTTRVEGAVTYNQVWDCENRLTSVTANGQTTQFVYDANGALVKKVVGTVTTVYVGQYFEKNTSTQVITSYYYAGSTRVAMRKGGVVSYLSADHLGSASLATDANGSVVANSSTRYYPYGATRSGGTGMPTDYRFTGQLLDPSTSLYHMGARWYDPYINRWLSADTLVPEPANPQSLNRYSWVLENPLGLADPTGHCAASEGDPANDACWAEYDKALLLGYAYDFLKLWDIVQLAALVAWHNAGIHFEGSFQSAELLDVIGVLNDYAGEFGMTRVSQILIEGVVGQSGVGPARLTISRIQGDSGTGWADKLGVIAYSDAPWDKDYREAKYWHRSFLKREDITTWMLAHEVGHTFVDGLRFEHPSDSSFLENGYSATVTGFHVAHPGNPNESVATEIALTTALDKSRPGDVGIFTEQYLLPAVYGPDTSQAGRGPQ